jgi:iron complex outermembrane receptor protein
MDSPASYISPENFDSVTIIKGPQTVLWGGGGSAGTILFDRKQPKFGGPEAHISAGMLAGSNDRFDQNVDAVAGTERVYARAVANHGRSGDYKDGSGKTIPSKWEKWNADFALGITPNENTLLEFSGGTGDGEARYADRGMDGSRFKRESYQGLYPVQLHGPHRHRHGRQRGRPDHGRGSRLFTFPHGPSQVQLKPGLCLG